ncbi:HK97 gp10 family phage protein [Falsochrobactrum sp. TDYN1]|uniref:HK97 gp10 family phage protein n=1 Tax=Falsochrobactrum tianjinense TaxID=2706015 RepID=A0A949PPR4_9HYPH|nr:HK97-gp10 family putative phage morphogenesis protein [Falsochrobactrum sp. TDYN1]MBV2144409.1 HK97 gp10 family phage protein [Falsochrobactrum sp. TDYN1]
MADDGGLSRFQRRMNAIPKAVREAVKPALVKSAQEMASGMKRLAETSRDTGALIDSIEATGPGQQTPPYSQPGGSNQVKENEAVVTAGNKNVRYAHLVEYGTTASSAQPFFWPTVRTQNKRAANRIKRAMRKSIKENWGKK